MPDAPSPMTSPDQTAVPHWAHAVLLGDRLIVDRSVQSDVISTAPFAFRKAGGYVVVFRYGAAVLIGLSPDDEADALRIIAPGAKIIEEERVSFEIAPEAEDGPTTTGILCLKSLDPARALVMADILGKSVALARYEKEMPRSSTRSSRQPTRLPPAGAFPRQGGRCCN